ncbi:MAG: gliding motility-associated C-terminal domain-containing protein, partial [Saprospiraceae bacterium]
GLIYIDVANSCSTAHDTVMINALPAIPVLSLGADTAICPGASITLSIGYSNVDILWPDGSTNADFIVTDCSTVYSSISNSCGVSTDSITISFLPDVPSLNLGPDQNLCLGEVITLDPNIPDVTYLWQDGTTNTTYQIDHGGMFFLTIANACGETTDSIQITISTDGPQLDLGPDLKACIGEVVTIPAGISGVNYLWQDGSVNDEFVTSSSGTFILSVSNLCGSDTDTIVVDIDGLPPSTDVGPDTTLCGGNTLLLTSNGVNLSSLMWQDGSSSPSYLVSSAGTYTLTESNTCGVGKDSIHISFDDAPEPFDLGRDTIICPGKSILLNAPSTSNIILWQDGSNSQTLVADKANTYSLQISNHCGVVSDSLKVGIDQQQPILNLDTLLRWCAGDVFLLDASQSIAASYLWNTGDITPAITVTGPGLYSIDVTTHCTSISDEVEVIPEVDCTKGDDIYIPNVFSPNGDGNNDVFSIFIGTDINVLSIDGSIFDRWGNMVFNSTIFPFAWDGHIKQDRMMPGVYVYSMHLIYELNGSTFVKDFKEDLTLIR